MRNEKQRPAERQRQYDETLKYTDTWKNNKQLKNYVNVNNNKNAHQVRDFNASEIGRNKMAQTDRSYKSVIRDPTTNY